MSLTLVRHFDLSGAVDADPIILQPQDSELFGPLVTSKTGRFLFNAWVVDSVGRPQPTGGLTVSLTVVTWSTLSGPAPVAPATVPAGFGAWGRGPISVGVVPGEWQVQVELGPVAGAQVAVTAKSASPSAWLAIYADLDWVMT